MSHLAAPTPTQTPPPPPDPFPRTRQQDRFSCSSTLTTSTSSGSSVLSALLVSPATPTRAEFTWTAVVSSPVEEVGDYEEEQHASGTWGPRTPTMGGHLGVPAEEVVAAGMSNRGDTKNWWAGVSRRPRVKISLHR